MRSEQHVQQVAIADHFRVKGNAKGLGMTGYTRADLLIGGISLVPANVAAFHRQYAFQRIEHRFSAPEASACQSRSEEHTSELQSLMRISYAVFCLKKNNQTKNHINKSEMCK